MDELEKAITKLVNDIWGKYDVDNSGELDKDETRKFLTKILRDMNYREELDDEDFDELFSEFDEDGNGTIEKEEMV